MSSQHTSNLIGTGKPTHGDRNIILKNILYELTKEDSLRLPAALNAFNGFYTRRGSLILMNSGHCRVVRAMLA